MPKPTTKQPAKPEKKTPSTALAAKPVKQAQPLATSIINAEDDAGAGMENIGTADMAIPQLVILQSGSPQVKKSDPAHIKGAEEGAICDPLNEKLFPGDKGISVIPVSYRRGHVEWKPRDSGGGFVRDHGSDAKILEQCKADEKGRMILPNKNSISVVAEYFVFLLLPDGSAAPYVLRMASTQLKKARRWNTMMNQLQAPRSNGGTFNPAMFYRSYELTTVPEQNDYGSWFGWKITPGSNTLDLRNGQEIYQRARDFRQQVATGNVRTHAPTQDAHAGAAGAREDDEAPM